MISRHIIKTSRFLKKKREFTFLNVVCLLSLLLILLTALTMRYSLDIKLKSHAIPEKTSVYHDLSYIKPFTSLVGFNWKFNKENKRKVRENKPNVLTITFNTLKTSF